MLAEIATVERKEIENLYVAEGRIPYMVEEVLNKYPKWKIITIDPNKVDSHINSYNFEGKSEKPRFDRMVRMIRKGKDIAPIIIEKTIKPSKAHQVEGATFDEPIDGYARLAAHKKLGKPIKVLMPDLGKNPLTAKEKKEVKDLANIQFAISRKYSGDPTRSEFWRGRSVGMGKIAQQFNPIKTKTGMPRTLEKRIETKARKYLKSGRALTINEGIEMAMRESGTWKGYEGWKNPSLKMPVKSQKQRDDILNTAFPKGQQFNPLQKHSHAHTIIRKLESGPKQTSDLLSSGQYYYLRGNQQQAIQRLLKLNLISRVNRGQYKITALGKKELEKLDFPYSKPEDKIKDMLHDGYTLEEAKKYTKQAWKRIFGKDIKLNPFPQKGVGTRKFGGETYYYAGRTIYPTKAVSEAMELRHAGISTKITKSKGAGSLIWAKKPVMLDLAEPIFNPKDIGRIDWMPRKKVWRVIFYKGKTDIPMGDYNTKEEATKKLQTLVWLTSKNPTLKIPIKSQKQLGHLSDAQESLGKAGVTFDSSSGIKNKKVFDRQWDLDWSLKGATISNPLVDVAECPKCHRKRGERHVATTKRPSIATMEKWMNSGVARATDGCRVEPDGTCPHGHQSWIMRLGFINPKELFKKTPAQRRKAYALAKELGQTPGRARRTRDYRSTTIFRTSGMSVPSLAERRAMGLVNPNDKSKKRKMEVRYARLRKKSKDDLLEIFGQYHGVHSATKSTPKGDLIAGILEAEGLISNPILGTIGSAAITGAGLGMGFKAVDYVGRKIVKRRNPSNTGKGIGGLLLVGLLVAWLLRRNTV